MNKNRISSLRFDNVVICVECSKRFGCDHDIQLCDKCINKFRLDDLWKAHDNNQLDALDFNENKSLREQYRIKSPK